MLETAILGAGCFWGVEETFRQTPGVVDTQVGYAGGEVESPSYHQVCTGTTGHAEVVRVTFDPQRVRFDEILEVFWAVHDPTTRDRQGPDIGRQYRSLILCLDEAQREVAERSRRQLEASGRYGHPVVTEIAPATPFYPAEEYHQRYLAKQRQGR